MTICRSSKSLILNNFSLCGDIHHAGFRKYKMIPPLAQLYSPSLDKYFHSDNALFIYENGEWVEYLEKVDDLITL